MYWSLRYFWQILNETCRNASVTFAMPVPPSMFLLEIIINVKPNTVHKINLGQTYFPPSVLTYFIPVAPSSGRVVLVAFAERPQIGWRVRQCG
jgi:hypothetical protein